MAVLDVYVVSYVGNGISQLIALPWDADVVLVQRRDLINASAGVWRVRARDGEISTNSQYIQEYFNYSNLIVGLPSMGVSLGDGAEVNALGATYDLIAFKEGPAFEVVSWTGDGDLEGQPVEFSFPPVMIWMQGAIVPHETRIRSEDMVATAQKGISNSEGDEAGNPGLGLHRVGGPESTSYLAMGVSAEADAHEDMNASGQTYYAVAWGPAVNFGLTFWNGEGGDNRVIAVDLNTVDWAFLLNGNSVPNDHGSFMRISGYDETDISAQIISGTPSKANVIQRLLDTAVEVGGLADVIVEGPVPHRLFVAKVLEAGEEGEEEEAPGEEEAPARRVPQAQII